MKSGTVQLKEMKKLKNRLQKFLVFVTWSSIKYISLLKTNRTPMIHCFLNDIFYAGSIALTPSMNYNYVTIKINKIYTWYYSQKDFSKHFNLMVFIRSSYSKKARLNEWKPIMVCTMILFKSTTMEYGKLYWLYHCTTETQIPCLWSHTWLVEPTTPSNTLIN